MRLDEALVVRGLFPSRTRAQAVIKGGLVSVNQTLTVKPAQKVSEQDAIEIKGDVHPYVSRGGLKLEAALNAFHIDPAGRICLDLGASTGGFTDVLLKRGATKVYAVDVGTGQLHASLLGEARIINLDKTHAKDLTVSLVPEPIDLIVCDVSFISLKKALPPALALAAPVAKLAALVKPQFEVGAENIGKGGIVKSGRENAEGVAEDIGAWIDTQPDWRFLRYIDSPIKGGDGAREFLIAASKEV